ncbi:MarR family transcriptional regulator [Peribacillus muralis]|uniref:MarR family winged helix-turn-helix transcriptional regulator n=1 Tax=Peribacillus muralis TaxID=264697 RepID=UPI001F4DC462|nr:MarR family transcriptional regulator [Peribacillus muralis]MCK1992049.1 MarR family transcriptional regulator [Peribacillus muralis]MCK2012605.1 MarR family transcriptional regulator [Peribacillus muralis]
MSFSFDDYISISIHKTDLAFTQYVKNKLADFNIAPEQNLIIMLLLKNDGLTQIELAEKLNKDKTNIARMVYNLEQKGFIKRSPDVNDRRSLKVFLTDKGKELSNIVIPIAEEFNNVVTKGITDEELENLKVLLNKMRENLRS